MPTIFSGVENRISEARERHQELHRTTAQAKRLTSTVNALNERQKALDTKAKRSTHPVPARRNRQPHRTQKAVKHHGCQETLRGMRQRRTRTQPQLRSLRQQARTLVQGRRPPRHPHTPQKHLRRLRATRPPNQPRLQNLHQTRTTAC